MRVIAGELGGRRLIAPKGRSTRPTSDRVREAIFATLGSVEGTRVLDLYAGSGALAIEALSRGAAEASVVEKAPMALRALRQNLTSLELEDRCRVYATTVARSLRSLSREAFDLVLADPPYADVADAARAIDAFVSSGGLREGGRVVIEHAARDEAPRLAHVRSLRTRRYGDTAVSFYVGEVAGSGLAAD